MKISGFHVQFRSMFCCKDNLKAHSVNTLERLCLIKSEEHLSKMGISSFGDQLHLLDCMSTLRVEQNAKRTSNLRSSISCQQPAKRMRQCTLPFLSQVQAKRHVEDYEKKPYDSFMYPNPKSAKPKFFNEVTPTLFESFGKHLPKEQCKTYIRKGRQSRRERFENFKTMNHRFQAMFNPEYTGRFHKLFLKSPPFHGNCI